MFCKVCFYFQNNASLILYWKIWVKMGKNKGQFKKGRGPFNFSHDKVKEEKTGTDEIEKQKTDLEIDDNGWYYCTGQL